MPRDPNTERAAPARARARALTAGLILAACAALVAAPGTRAQAPASTAAAPPAAPAGTVGSPVDCVAARDIRSTRIRSGSVIDFHMRNGTVLRNDLGDRCGSLSPRDAITYNRIGSNLCRGDPITVLDQPGLIPTASCPLGSFHLLDPAVSDTDAAD